MISKSFLFEHTFNDCINLYWYEIGGLNWWRYLVICYRPYPSKFTFNRNETSWRFLYRVKSAKKNSSYNFHKNTIGNHLWVPFENVDLHSFTYDASKKKALRKKGDSQVNKMPFKTKDFSRVIMNKSTFRNSFLNNRTD